MKKFLTLLLLFYSFAYSLEDMLGRDVDVSKADRLVFIGPGALRLGTYAGAYDKLVGIERIELKKGKMVPYRNFLKQKNVLDLPIIGEGGPGKMPSVEALINSKAQLIIASFVDKNQVKLIEQKTKIPVFVISYGNGYGGDMGKLNSIKKSLGLIGKIIKKESRVNELISWMDEEEKKLASLKLSNKTVYVGGIGYKGPWGIQSTEMDYLPFLFTKANVALKTKKRGHLFLDIEKVLELDPDIIFIDKGGVKKFEEQKKKKGALFANMKAFKNNNVHEVPIFNFYNTNVENSFYASWVVAKSLGAEVELEKEKKRIFSIFLK